MRARDHVANRSRWARRACFLRAQLEPRNRLSALSVANAYAAAFGRVLVSVSEEDAHGGASLDARRYG